MPSESTQPKPRRSRLRRILIFSGIAAGSLALLLGWNISFAQSEESRYFPETGHVVSGDFLRFYEQVTNAEFVFGYPITDEFTDQTTGMLVQYF